MLAHELAPVSGDVLPERVTVPSHVGELTMEQAQSARHQCTKCLKSGCTHCMGGWFLPKRVVKSVAVAVAETVAESVAVAETVEASEIADLD